MRFGAILMLTISLGMVLGLTGCQKKTPTEQATELAIEQLKSLDYEEYAETVRYLSEMEPVSVSVLMKGLKNRDDGVRAGCAEVLGRRRVLAAVEPLLKKTKDRGGFQVRDGYTTITEVCVGVEAIRALGRIGDRRAVEPLIELLRNSNPDFREAAIGALGDLGDERAIAPLIERVRDPIMILGQYAGDVLQGLTGQYYYDDYEAWKAWYEREHGSLALALD